MQAGTKPFPCHGWGRSLLPRQSWPCPGAPAGYKMPFTQAHPEMWGPGWLLPARAVTQARVGWHTARGFAHAGRSMPTCHARDPENPNQAGGREPRHGFEKRKNKASSSTSSPHSLPGCRSIFSTQQSSGGPSTSQHICAIQPSHGQSWHQQGRIPQQTARPYHTLSLLFKFSVFI